MEILNTDPIYLGLGSNIGDRKHHITSALTLLSYQVSICGISSIYETEPWGNKEQPMFLNCVCGVRSRLGPSKLLEIILQTESNIGRTRSYKNAPRIIDIDILFYGDRIISEPELNIPHPSLHERAFVLIPLVEIAKDLVHPIIGKTSKQLLSELSPMEIDGVRRWHEGGFVRNMQNQ